MEEIILIILLLLSMLTIFCLYQIFDKKGLYFSLVIMNLISLILSFKITNILKMNINLGIVPLMASFSIIYIFISKYGYKEIKDLILVSLYSNITASLLLVIMNYFIPSITETISINMQGTFGYNYKILIVYPIIIMLSQLSTIKLYRLIYDAQKNISTCVILTHIIVGPLYTIVFSLLSYINILDIKSSLFLGMGSYLLGILLIIMNLLIINYLAKKKVTQ